MTYLEVDGSGQMKNAKNCAENFDFFIDVLFLIYKVCLEIYILCTFEDIPEYLWGNGSYGYGMKSQNLAIFTGKLNSKNFVWKIVFYFIKDNIVR